MTRGRPGTRQQRETYDIDIGIPSTPEAKFLSALELLDLASNQSIKGGAIQAIAEVAAEEFRQWRIDSVTFYAPDFREKVRAQIREFLK